MNYVPKKPRKARRPHYRVAPAYRASGADPAAETRADIPRIPAATMGATESSEDDIATNAQIPVPPLAEPTHTDTLVSPFAEIDDFSSAAPPAYLVGPADLEPRASDRVIDAPTIVLTVEQIAQLSAAQPDAPGLIPPDAWAEDTQERPTPTARDLPDNPYASEADAPTIVLDIHTLMATPPIPSAPPRPPQPDVSYHPEPRRPTHPPSPVSPNSRPKPALPATSPLKDRASSGTSWPRVPQPFNPSSVQHGQHVADPAGDFARLREQRLSHRLPTPDNEPHVTAFTTHLRDFWRSIKPGLDRVLGRSHRAGVRGVRSTTSQTSAQMPAISLKSLDEDAPSAPSRRSSTARELGSEAHDAALPALVKLHSRAERAAQRLIDRIDASMGAAPPMQHVLIGPGRMVVTFAPGVTIRNAQYVISMVSARPLRRIIGYNAYLVLVPPGRESRYADRFRSYHEVIGVHFGPPRSTSPSASSVGAH